MILNSQPLRLVMLAGRDGLTTTIGALLQDGGQCDLVEAGEADALLIDAFDDPDGIPALALEDDQFDTAFVEKTLDRAAALQEGVTRLLRPANIVVIGSDAYLGRWNGLAQAAASAAMVGMMRSLAMEYAPQQLRVNMLALPLGTRSDDRALMQDATSQALDLLTTRSISGETILLDDGNNLKFRQARRRGGDA